MTNTYLLSRKANARANVCLIFRHQKNYTKPLLKMNSWW